MDTITVAASDKLENVVASSGDFVANGNLIFSPGNGFQSRRELHWPGMELTRFGFSSFTHVQLFLIQGPVLLTEAIMDFCKVGRQTGLPIIGHHKNCWNLSVFNYPAFYPLES